MMFLRSLFSLSLVTLVLYLNACGPTPTPPPNPGAALRDVTWQLVFMGAPADQATALTKYNNITAAFGADGRLTGSGGCNSYSGGYTLDGNKLTVGPVASTKKACSEGSIMQQEQQFFNSLARAESLELAGNDLRIRTDGGAGVLVFTRAK